MTSRRVTFDKAWDAGEKEIALQVEPVMTKDADGKPRKTLLSGIGSV